MPHAIDAGFLEERLQPTAIVLADPRQTWPGRSDMRCVLCAEGWAAIARGGGPRGYVDLALMRPSSLSPPSGRETQKARRRTPQL